MENLEKNKNLALEDSIAKGKLKAEMSKGVRKGAWIAGGIGVFVLLISVLVAWVSFRKEQGRHMTLMENQRLSYNKQLNTRDSTISEWLATFDQIENDLNRIKQKEKLLSINSSARELSKDRKDRILEDIRLINTLLDNNKKKIAELSGQLYNSGKAMKGFQARITALESQIKTYEADISSLKETLVKKDFEITQLNSRVTDLNAAVTQKEETISSQISYMNKGYLVSGTYRELKEKGIVSREGGFLGLGRTGAISKNISDSMFAKVDIRDLRSIEVNNAKNVKLISRHPTNSYKMIKNGNNTISSIEIEDPQNFWKLSRYAVVELIK